MANQRCCLYKNKYSLLSFRKCLFEIFFSWDSSRVSTPVFYKYYFDYTIEVNYLIKQHECFRISCLSSDVVEA